MAGLMSPGPTNSEAVPNRTPALASDAPMPAGEEGGDPQGNVSPEEQAQYERFVNNGFKLIYSKNVMPKVLDMLKGNGDPKEGLANATVMAVMKLEESAGKGGKPISPDVIYHGGVALLEDLADLAGEAGIHDFTPEEIEGAMYRALDIYREMKQASGGMDAEAMRNDFAELVRADQSGELEQIMPGVGGHMKGKPEGGAPPEGEEEPAPEDEEEAPPAEEEDEDEEDEAPGGLMPRRRRPGRA